MSDKDQISYLSNIISDNDTKMQDLKDEAKTIQANFDLLKEAYLKAEKEIGFYSAFYGGSGFLFLGSDLNKSAMELCK